MQPLGLWQTFRVFYVQNLAWFVPLLFPCLHYLAAVTLRIWNTTIDHTHTMRIVWNQLDRSQAEWDLMRSHCESPNPQSWSSWRNHTVPGKNLMLQSAKLSNGGEQPRHTFLMVLGIFLCFRHRLTIVKQGKTRIWSRWRLWNKQTRRKFLHASRQGSHIYCIKSR